MKQARRWMFAGGLLAGSLLGAPLPPANDNLVNATPLTGTNVVLTASSRGATKEIGEPNHGGNPGGVSLWWAWTAPASGSVLIGTAGSSFDTLLSAYTGATLLGLSQIANNDDAGSQKTSLVGFNVVEGISYRIAVDGFNGAVGDVQLTVTFRPTPLGRPSNDDFAQRLPLAGAFVQTVGSNFFAGKEPGEPNHALELGGASVWWSWTAPADGRVVVSTEGSQIDTLLAIYSGTVLTNLTVVARNDDISTNQPASRASFRAVANASYEIVVDGFAGEPGDIQLQISMEDTLWLAEPVSLPNGAVRLTLVGRAGRSYTLEATSDLNNWQPIASLNSTNGIMRFEDPPLRGTGRRFYRAEQSR